MNPQARFPYILRVASIFIVMVLLVVTLYYLKVVLVPILFSVIFAVMLFPFAMKLERLGVSKGLAAFLTVFITTVILGFFSLPDFHTAKCILCTGATTLR